MSIAFEQGATFYDSSYLSMARARNAVLVTEDAELSRRHGGLASRRRVSEYLESYPVYA